MYVLQDSTSSVSKTLVDEGEHCVVILDRNQAARGHLLVIPKRTWNSGTSSTCRWSPR